MKTSIFLTIAAALCLVACDDDKETLVVSGMGSATLTCSAAGTSIELDADKADEEAVSFTWQNADLALSNPDYALPEMVQNKLQFSTSDTFDPMVSVSVGTGNQASFTGAELNSTVFRLGVGDAGADIFVRMASVYGSNQAEHYSGAVTFFVRPFVLDMTTLRIFSRSGDEVGDEVAHLYSPDSDRNYAGFVVTPGTWFNFYAFEGDDTQLGTDANWTAFSLIESTNNMWFPDAKGAFYVTASVPDAEWTCLHLGDVTFAGGAEAAVAVADASAATLTAIVTTTDADAAITVSGTGKRYDLTTGTDAGADVEYAFAFEADGSLGFVSGSTAGTALTIAEAGTYTITLSLDGARPAYTIESGAAEMPVPQLEQVYLIGLDDNIFGGWSFDHSVLSHSADSVFTGVLWVDSQWGFQVATVKDDWGSVYKLGETEGTIAWGGSDNIPAPEAGLYRISIDLKNLTYSFEAVTLGDALYVVGLNNDWDTFIEIAKTDAEGVYSGAIEVTLKSDWGFQILVDKSDWDTKFGGADGRLVFGQNLTDPAEETAGTYTLTVNLREATYSLTAAESE